MSDQSSQLRQLGKESLSCREVLLSRSAWCLVSSQDLRSQVDLKLLVSSSWIVVESENFVQELRTKFGVCGTSLTLSLRMIADWYSISAIWRVKGVT